MEEIIQLIKVQSKESVVVMTMLDRDARCCNIYESLKDWQTLENGAGENFWISRQDAFLAELDGVVWLPTATFHMAQKWSKL